jgi:cytochrome d ubiquinol oxidase subunit I
MGYEVLTAFFLEAGFLGLMLFGLKRVGRGLHFFATCMVALGTLLSAFWIIAANSWMHTPAGFEMRGEQFVPVDWWAVIFNPSFPYRLAHMVLAAYLTTALVVGATGAWHLLRERSDEAARVMFSMAMWMAAAVAPLQLLAGDLHGLNTLEHQPAKIAAIEGHWETQRGAPLYLIAWPDMDAETTHGIAVPRLGSLILTHEWDGEIRGLKSWPPQDRPHSPTVFWSFRVMVGMGLLMILTGIVSLYLRWRRRLFEHPLFLRAVLCLGPGGFVAVLAGWITTEAGRQPYVVYGLMRTLEARSPIDAPAVASSLAAFVLVYFLVFGAGIYYLLQLMRRPPAPLEPGPDPRLPQRAAGITPAPALEAGK